MLSTIYEYRPHSPRCFASNRSPVQNLVYKYLTEPIELQMHDKMEKKRGFRSQGLDNAKLKLSKLLSGNYNAQSFFQRLTLYMYIHMYFCISHFHLRSGF